MHVLDAQKRVPPGSACGPCAGDGGGRRKLVFLNPRECKRNSFAKKRIVGSQPSWLTRPAGLQPAPIDPLKACRPSQATSLTSVSLAPLRRDMLPHVHGCAAAHPPGESRLGIELLPNESGIEQFCPVYAIVAHFHTYQKIARHRQVMGQSCVYPRGVMSESQHLAFKRALE